MGGEGRGAESCDIRSREGSIAAGDGVGRGMGIEREREDEMERGSTCHLVKLPATRGSPFTGSFSVIFIHIFIDVVNWNANR